MKDFFRKCDQIRSFLRLWSPWLHFLCNVWFFGSDFSKNGISGVTRRSKHHIDFSIFKFIYVTDFIWNKQKQAFRGVSENMQQIYRRIHLPRCDFNITNLFRKVNNTFVLMWKRLLIIKIFECFECLKTFETYGNLCRQIKCFKNTILVEKHKGVSND